LKLNAALDYSVCGDGTVGVSSEDSIIDQPDRPSFQIDLEGKAPFPMCSAPRYKALEM
jgi:hypothetical protein